MSTVPIASNIREAARDAQKFQPAEVKLLEQFLDFLRDPRHLPNLEPRKIWMAPFLNFLKALRRATDYRLDHRLTEIETETENLGKYRRYKTKNMSMMVRPEDGNLGESQRLLVAAVVQYAINPTASVYKALAERLKARGDHREPESIKQRVLRLEIKIQNGKQFPLREIVTNHYSHSKFLRVSHANAERLRPQAASESYIRKLAREFPDIARLNREQPEDLRKYLHPPLQRRVIRSITDQLAFTETEKAMLEKVCCEWESRRNPPG